MISSLEGYWGFLGAPRCPLSAADSSAVAALLSGRFCGPGPFRQHAADLARGSLELASEDAQG
eukprot:1724022-Lingulodinium_polyedra.AAC.1